ncbi:DUF4034 domain-containing protein [Kitasatospora camelliae]|uniref:DUF4034 domain-containing protein n=1 Tax=Kitasatospora camelliae TaxID=3156397 RepID=A0AAU8JZ79_9ACTN
MAVLILLVPLLIWAGAKLVTWYFKNKLARLEKKIADHAAVTEDLAAELGLPAGEELDLSRPGPPTRGTAVVAAARPAAEKGDWKPFAEYLAEAGEDWDVRYHRLQPIAEAAAEEDGWLKAWQAAEPGSPDAALVHATALIELAWEVRSAKQAKHVSREQFEAFHRILGEAVAASDVAAELAPADPSPWVSRLPVAMGLGWSHEEFGAVWDEVVRRAPHHYSAHQTALQYWCAKWRGSHELMTAFADRAAADAPPRSLLSGLRLVALHELEFTQDDYSAWQTPEAQHALDRVLADLETVPADDHRVPALRQLLAYGLTHNRRWAEAVEQFRLIGKYIGGAPWTYTGDPAGVFLQIRNRALRGWHEAGRPALPSAGAGGSAASGAGASDAESETAGGR